MSVEQWRFGIRPEVKLTRFVIINGIRFDLLEVIEVLDALKDADGLFSPITIRNRELADMLCEEGLAYDNTKGSFGGTELVSEALDKMEELLYAEVAETANPQLKYGYMDSTTFDCELGNTNADIYAGPEDVKAAEKCARDGECGIVKVAVYATEVVEWPKEQDGDSPAGEET